MLDRLVITQSVQDEAMNANFKEHDAESSTKGKVQKLSNTNH